MYTKISKLMGLKYLHYNAIKSHRSKIDVTCRDQIVHSGYVFLEQCNMPLALFVKTCFLEH